MGGSWDCVPPRSCRSRESQEGGGRESGLLLEEMQLWFRDVHIAQLWLVFLRVLRGERRVSPVSPNKVHSDPSNSLHCPLAAAAALGGGLAFPHAQREVLPPEIIALLSTVDRDNVLNKGGEAGAGPISAWAV